MAFGFGWDGTSESLGSAHLDTIDGDGLASSSIHSFHAPFMVLSIDNSIQSHRCMLA